jgi:photosystem II stability/assembly factor-like uncharacterized protein
VSQSFFRRFFAFGLLAAALPQLHAERWKVQYLYENFKSEMVLQDLQFPSATRGIAIGEIVDGRSRKGVAVVTSDGGGHWDVVKLDEIPVSLFFLNDSLGWMVTEKGLWKTSEAGKDWQKLPKPPNQPWRVYFADENNGWAACTKKMSLATHDGGRKWEPIPAASTVPGASDRSAYSWIAFADKDFGMITGFNQPSMRWAGLFPTWLDPEDALSRRETPHLAYQLLTRDGGKTWKAGSASLLGQITRVRFGPKGGVGLIEYGDSFRVPSEVYHLDKLTGKSQTVFRDKRYAITDVWLTAEGTAYLAGIELTGQVRSVSPGKVKVFRSPDMTTWTELDVDYRAIAQRAMIAGADEQNLWIATDNGMILRLNKTP